MIALEGKNGHIVNISHYWTVYKLIQSTKA